MRVEGYEASTVTLGAWGDHQRISLHVERREFAPMMDWRTLEEEIILALGSRRWCGSERRTEEYQELPDDSRVIILADFLPAPIRNALYNYSNLVDVFSKSEEQRDRYRAFDAWWGAPQG
ncbi:MAG TPA: hypothetical protein VNI57_07210 [Candidatus Saccharimonadales bacterium]|nr:hypothetical protein [Candidatus Saccharimonadales bacterium]